jgi:hypothetical protein
LAGLQRNRGKLACSHRSAAFGVEGIRGYNNNETGDGIEYNGASAFSHQYGGAFGLCKFALAAQESAWDTCTTETRTKSKLTVTTWCTLNFDAHPSFTSEANKHWPA